MTSNEIKAIRTGLGLTPGQMADVLGISIKTYYGWEGGKPIQPLASTAVSLLAFIPESTRENWIAYKAGKA